jgi:CubicO group peptidase (beta-lactamase class C family)
VHGQVDERFAVVRDVFRENLDRGELGASCCVVVQGRRVVDLWGGWADPERSRPWTADTLANSYSVGKPIVALQLLQLVASGQVDLDGTADRWWPELRAGQQGATVRQVLSHRAGVPALRQPMANDALWSWQSMTQAVAETEPWWTPGERHAYHCNTYGFLVGELARRVTGEEPGAWLRDHVAGPLGAVLVWGVPGGDLDRCADVVWTVGLGELDWDDLDEMSADERMVTLGYFNPPGFSSLGVVNTEAWRRCQVPSTNLHASARGIARLYQALAAGGQVDGVHLLDADVLAEATRPQSEGWCPFLQREVSFGLGFQPTRPDRPFGPNVGSYGHFGSGGALGMADPEAEMAFGYTMNAVTPGWRNERNRSLLDAVYACL